MPSSPGPVRLWNCALLEMDNLRLALAFLNDTDSQQILNVLAAGGFTMTPVWSILSGSAPLSAETDTWNALILSVDPDTPSAVQLIQSVRSRGLHLPILAVGESESIAFSNTLLDAGANRYIPSSLINQYLALALTAALRESQTDHEIASVKARLTSAVSHEFRNPLTIALSSTELLIAYGESWSSDGRMSQLEQIHTAVQRLNQIVSDVLDLQLLDGTPVAETSPCADVITICRLAIANVSDWDQNNHPINFALPAPDFTEQAPPDLFYLVVLHLLLNAIRFSAPSMPVVVELSPGSNCYRLTITDQGSGIPADEIPWVFGRFCRGRNVRKIPGVGLGLTIARLAANSLGGDITLDSHLDSGTRAVATFPTQLTGR